MEFATIVSCCFGRALLRLGLTLLLLSGTQPLLLRGAESAWVPRNSPWAGPITGLCYGTNRFVAVGSLVALGTFQNSIYKGVALTSETGERWQAFGVPQD